MKHLVRAGVLLALVVLGFLYVRSMSTVVSIEAVGISHDDNPRAWASRPVQNQDSADCAECHKATNTSWQASIHARVTCEDCHGSTREHIAQARKGESAPLTIADGRDLCLTCHARVPGRPSGFPQVDPSLHVEALGGAAASCATCHTPHNPGLPLEIPHSLEGRSACLVCHGPDQWKPVPPDHAKRSQDICLTCHRAKETK